MAKTKKETVQDADAVKAAKISELVPDDKNFNKGTEYGQHLLEKSLRELGAGRSVLIDKNNRIIAGNKTVENAAQIGLEDVIVVETDGTKLVAVKRTDVDLDSKQGRELALADNAVGAADLEFDNDLIAEVSAEQGIEADKWGWQRIEEEIEEDEEEIKADVPFTEVLSEEHNYVVLYFDNNVDWLQAQGLFNIQQAQALPTKRGENKKSFGKKLGVGRVINGAKALEMIRKEYGHIN